MDRQITEDTESTVSDYGQYDTKEQFNEFFQRPLAEPPSFNYPEFIEQIQDEFKQMREHPENFHPNTPIRMSYVDIKVESCLLTTYCEWAANMAQWSGNVVLTFPSPELFEAANFYIGLARELLIDSGESLKERGELEEKYKDELDGRREGTAPTVNANPESTEETESNTSENETYDEKKLYREFFPRPLGEPPCFPYDDFIKQIKEELQDMKEHSHFSVRASFMDIKIEACLLSGYGERMSNMALAASKLVKELPMPKFLEAASFYAGLAQELLIDQNELMEKWDELEAEHIHGSHKSEEEKSSRSCRPMSSESEGYVTAEE